MADKADNESTAGSQFRRNLCSIFRENKNIVFSLITTLSLSLIGLLLTVYVWPVHNWQVSKFLDSKEAGDRSTKHIAVVITKKSGTTFTIPEEFRKGFGDSPNFDTSTGQKIEFIREDDFLSPDQAKIIAHKLLENNNNVLIIGNSTSSLTEVTLNEILKYPDIKPGFLLPIATADNIIEKAKDQNFGSILRMMPNNDKQADTIKNFIFRKFNNKSPRIAIFSDEENTTYSHSLSQKIADKIIIEKGTVVLKKDYGNSNRLIDNIENLETYKQMPDVYVFVGISTNGSLFKEELKNL
ncbi:MAG: ABC transporter substrate-binding protein, partial [Nitrosomonas sp.]|nr:ABC transporter substrate-binding protein [Nitrosomonas sp.]